MDFFSLGSTKMIAFTGYCSRTYLWSGVCSTNSRSVKPYYPFTIISSDNKSILLSRHIVVRQIASGYGNSTVLSPLKTSRTTPCDMFEHPSMSTIHFQYSFIATRTHRCLPFWKNTAEEKKRDVREDIIFFCTNVLTIYVFILHVKLLKLHLD